MSSAQRAAGPAQPSRSLRQLRTGRRERRPTAETASFPPQIFRSKLGWMGVVFCGQLLARITFGHDNPAAALSAIDGDHDIVNDPGRKTPATQNLVRRLRAYAAGAHDDFLDVPLLTDGMTDFQLAVIERCRRIPSGQVLTYGQLAAQAGYPRAARAVGNVMSSNRFPLIVPCHRVVAAGGALGGYSAASGLALKRQLLSREGSLDGDRVKVEE